MEAHSSPLPGQRAYLAAAGHEHRLERSLAGKFDRHGRLYVAGHAQDRAMFFHNVWNDLRRIDFASISQAANALRSLGRSWWPLDTHPGLHRRTQLIQQRLPHVSARPLTFPEPAPTTPLGSYTLLDAQTLLCSADCTSVFPNGEPRFVEDREGPPNRAYRKLWEALTLLGRRPGPGERCLDAGASPGGWTWVIARTGAKVLAVDRSPLERTVSEMPGVTFLEGSGFGIQPSDGTFDWIFSDMACYPRRLWVWTERWLQAGAVSNLVLTIKLQGEGDDDSLDRFRSVPGGELVHLHHNKHELTYLWPVTRSVNR